MQSDKSRDSGDLITRRTQFWIASGDARGKHRIPAELKRLEQEAIFLDEELEQLNRTEKSSTACDTNGPLNPLWDRWFEIPKESQGCRCWIL